MTPGWVPVALDLLAWSAKRSPLAESAINRLVQSAPPFLDRLSQKNLDSLYYISCGVPSSQQRIYDAVWSVQKCALLSLARTLAAENIEFFFFKGCECTQRWYGSRALGLFSDVDILIFRHDVGKVKAILYQSGYRQARFDQSRSRLVDRDVSDIALLEANHYELAPFARLMPVDLSPDDLSQPDVGIGHPLAVVDGLPMVVVELDIHHGVAIDVDVSDLTNDPRPSSFDVGLSFSDSNQVWLLTSRYYTEVALHGKLSLRDFAYVLPIIASGCVDWDVVVRAAKKYELRSSLYYYLSFMSPLAGGAVPEEVLSDLSPSNGTRLRDWGWQMGKLFDFVEPPPFPAARASEEFT